MARTTTPKGGKAAPKLRGQRQPLSISLPPELVAEIDVLASADRRPRSQMIEVMLVEAVKARQQRSAA